MNYYDALETRDPEERERDLMGKLAQQLRHARQHSPYYRHWLADRAACRMTVR